MALIWQMLRLRYNDYYFLALVKGVFNLWYKTKDRSENNSEVVIPIIEPLKNIFV